MASIHIATGRIYSDPAYALLFGYLVDQYCLINESILTKTCNLYIFDEDLSSFQSQYDITILSVNDWTNFKDWCNLQHITVNLQKKMIDSSKIWWPIQIEINCDSSVIDEYITLIQLIYY